MKTMFTKSFACINVQPPGYEIGLALISFMTIKVQTRTILHKNIFIFSPNNQK